MTDKDSLASARRAWIDAFVSADVESLQCIEAPGFVVLQGTEMTTKVEQIEALSTRRQALPRSDDFQLTQTIHAIHEQDDWATVAGSSIARRNGKVISECEFSEFWIVCDGRWVVASLHLNDRQT
ncbi:DUF4440 domain-containing protein [Cupriavidus agavae]|uniref:Uncharacterized protein DUF4440 n=1 Tax=Cupriavidus agavae TaxID=1001822 RepID=A0A4Q7S9I7_9BURK|nr:DUF4440 domain-containing protein [Cupriavidus agavae]RZT43033.1 uncharacterized protein DUF4440 [Cupriavidus agavae]